MAVVALGLAGCLWPVAEARASLLVYEGFDFSGLQNNDPVNGESGTTSLGWKSGSSWTQRTATATWDQTGLSFGSMPVAGGAVRIDDTTSNAATIDRQIDGSLAALSTVYGSFLFVPGTVNNDASSGFFTDPDSSRDNLAQVDSAASGVAFGSSNGSPLLNPGQTSSPEWTYTAGTATTTGTTYMAVFKYSGLGTTSTTLDLWILTEPQYESLYALGGGAEASLVARSTGTGAGDVLQFGSITENLAGVLTLGADKYLGFRVKNSAATIFDELRMSDNFIDAAAIPEPATGALLAGLLATGLLLRRRHRHFTSANRTDSE